MKNKCKHPKEKVSYGPRIPLRWGSAESQVCQCGMWRMNHHSIGKWKKKELLAEALKEDDEA